jgi:hypothetical protein
MTALLTSVPGDISGLLRRWSPVLVTIDSDKPPVHGMVLEPVFESDESDARCLVWSERNGRDNKAAMFVALDLTDATGRAHAAWWVRATVERQTDAWRNVARATEWALVQRAEVNDAMTPEQIDTLARLVLRLAGRTP